MKRERLSNALMVISILLIFAYIFYEVYSVSHIDIVTESAVISTVYDTVGAKAIVIRDEQPVNKASGVITVPCLKDGDKVNVGGNTAMTFSSQEAAESYSKYASLQEQLEYYEKLEKQSKGRVSSVESIDSEIGADVNKYIRAVADGSEEEINAAGDSLNDGLVRRRMIIGENVDLLSKTQSLRVEAEKYSANASPDSFIKTDVSGVFSGYTDGLEALLEYSKAEELTAEQVENAIKEAESNKRETDYLGKLVTSYEWYMECVTDAEAVKELKNGSTVQVSLKDSNDTVLNMQIVSGAETVPGQDKTLLVMKSSEMNETIAALRAEEVEIRIKKYEGIKLPATALHVNDKGEKGVYALVASQMHFRKAEVIYSADDYVMLKFDASEENGIRLHDKIIIKGKELKDGKIYD
ncbi:MAG: hypothetical protein K6C14_04775 [Eubacterium sp.]|nr:hypothetical protein [Eubacterium sp.]